jgi:hypothetical protein
MSNPICQNCQNAFEPKSWEDFRYDQKHRPPKRIFCSNKCLHEFRVKNDNITVPCGHCEQLITRNKKEHRKSKTGLLFCSCSCSASYHNKVKKKSRRSKCECLLFDLLSAEFPSIEFLPNNKTMLDGYEIDIAAPSLKFGIEWNGVVHFKPIHGDIKLSAIQQRDIIKSSIAQQKGIELVVVSDLVSTKKFVITAFEEISIRIREKLHENETSDLDGIRIRNLCRDRATL